MPKDEKLSKHQLIEKMWNDENFKISVITQRAYLILS